MFGYVIPDKMNMFMKDYFHYRAHYCGLCKRIGKDCGQFMRLSTNYDLVFLDLLVHDVLGLKSEYKNEPCILSPKKKSIAKGDDVTDKIVDVNTLLMYYKLLDDKVDSSKPNPLKSIARVGVVSSKYKKAKKNLPELDKIYDNEYTRLREYEVANEESLDKLADPFANMLRQTIKHLLGEKCTEDLETLMYFLGKWIYYIDAIDDIDKDYNKGEFNPLLVGYNYENKDKFFIDNQSRLDFMLMSSYNKMFECFEKIELTINNGPLTNIVWYGILMRTKDILANKCDCKKIRI